jgi:hypothetical protein
MPDYRHEVEFGYFLVPDAIEPEGVVETAVLADRLGYDLIGVQDHPYGTFLLVGPPDREALQLFIDEVAPEVRERVGAARDQSLSAAGARPT